MSEALPGEHLCAAHQGNTSHYDPQNCTICRLQRENADIKAGLAEAVRLLRGVIRERDEAKALASECAGRRATHNP